MISPAFITRWIHSTYRDIYWFFYLFNKLEAYLRVEGLKTFSALITSKGVTHVFSFLTDCK